MLLHLFSYNAWRSYANTQSLLETRRSLHNSILFIQEPFFGRIRGQKSNIQDLPEDILGPTLHPSFTCLFDYTGSGPYPMVVTYVHRSLRAFSPTLLPSPTRSLYHQIISIRTSKQGDIHMYNIYNSTREEALIELDAQQDLPPAFSVVGDFNLHSHSWDLTSRPSPLASLHRLHDVMAKLNVALASTPNVPTWFPPASSLSSPSTLDLVWTDPSRPLPSVSVLISPTDSFNSDHALLSFQLSTKFFKPDPSLTIPVDSDEEEAFITDITTLISDLPSLNGYASCAHLQREVTCLFNGIAASFKKLARPKITTPHSVPWWDSLCAHTLAEMHRERNPHTYRAWKAAVKNAKNKSFSSWVSASANAHRPWDLTILSKPRPLPSFLMMRKLDGSTMASKTEFWQELDSLFQNAASRHVDPSYRDILPHHPARPWSPFRPQELLDAIQGHSTNSAPGVDHVNWRHLKSILADDLALSKLADLYSACIFLGIWPTSLNSHKLSPSQNLRNRTTPPSKHTDLSPSSPVSESSPPRP